MFIFQTPHRAKGSREAGTTLSRECLFRSRKASEGEANEGRRKKRERGEKEREKGPGGRDSGAQSVGVSRLPSVLSPTRSVQALTARYFPLLPSLRACRLAKSFAVEKHRPRRSSALFFFFFLYIYIPVRLFASQK